MTENDTDTDSGLETDASSDDAPAGAPIAEVQFFRRLCEAGLADDSVRLRLRMAREVLTPRRVDIIHALHDLDAETVESISNLARLLDCDKSIIHDDLWRLWEVGIVEFDDDGHRKRPYLAHQSLHVIPLCHDGEWFGDGRPPDEMPTVLRDAPDSDSATDAGADTETSTQEGTDDGC